MFEISLADDDPACRGDWSGSVLGWDLAVWLVPSACVPCRLSDDLLTCGPGLVSSVVTDGVSLCSGEWSTVDLSACEVPAVSSDYFGVADEVSVWTVCHGASGCSSFVPGLALGYT